MNRRETPLVLIATLLCSVGSTTAAQTELVNWESPHVHPLDKTPDGSKLLAVNTPDNRLEVFDLASGIPIHEASIPVGLDPVSVRARSRHEAWVVNHVSDTVSIVDLRLGNVVATVVTDDEPCDVVFADAPPARPLAQHVPQRAFVSCSQANTVLVFDPDQPSLPPARVQIRGEDPRALAVSPEGDLVYAAIFESGNRTTILAGGAAVNIAFPPNVVSDPAGPYAGVNPPPNDAESFDPPLADGLPAPPAVGLIVRQNAQGEWLDDNAGDWTELVSGSQAAKSGRPVGWVLLDHDVAVIDAGTLRVSYVDGLMNLNMALAVNPGNKEVTVIGSDATNEVRFEPNVSGRFIRVELARFGSKGPAPVVADLNAHLDYTEATIDPSERQKTLSDPRGIAWNSAGSRGYVTGMGSNNVVVVDASGSRAGVSPAIDVGEGPTGIVLDETRQRLYVINKFAGSISVIDTTSELEVGRVGFYDPSPLAIKRGRRHLYDAHETSGTGLVSCASCHVDGRMDRLAWDLGDPTGTVKPVGPEQNRGGNVPGLNDGFQSWHPMKGPMLTQTLQDIIGHEPHHWRGDRNGLEEFNPAFEGLLGDDEQLTPAEMQEFEDFLATIFFSPNPFRNFDNSLPTDLPLPGHFTTGRFGPAGLPLPNGNAVQGEQSFRPPNRLDTGVLSCSACHTRPTGAGTDRRFQGGSFVQIPVGPNGEHHLQLVSVDGSTNVTMKTPQLRNLYERTGFDLTQPESTAGFGFIHDGSVDSIARFINEPVFTLTSDQQTANLVAFMLAFSGVSAPLGSLSNIQEPLGTSSQATHAAVGKQVTLAAAPDAAQEDLIDAMLAEADQGDIGLVVKGRKEDLSRGWYYLGGGLFQSDREHETTASAVLVSSAGPENELTWTAVPKGSEKRIGVDRDRDGYYDRDEIDAHSDPADPRIRPKHRAMTAGVVR